jgi:hypothetical protein
VVDGDLHVDHDAGPRHADVGGGRGLGTGDAGGIGRGARGAGHAPTASPRPVAASSAPSPRPRGAPTACGGARARAGRRAVRVKASTALRSTGELQQPVTTAVTERLDQLGPGGVLRPRVTVSQESSR